MASVVDGDFCERLIFGFRGLFHRGMGRSWRFLGSGGKVGEKVGEVVLICIQRDGSILI